MSILQSTNIIGVEAEPREAESREVETRQALEEGEKISYDVSLSVGIIIVLLGFLNQQQRVSNETADMEIG